MLLMPPVQQNSAMRSHGVSFCLGRNKKLKKKSRAQKTKNCYSLAKIKHQMSAGHGPGNECQSFIFNGKGHCSSLGQAAKPVRPFGKCLLSTSFPLLKGVPRPRPDSQTRRALTNEEIIHSLPVRQCVRHLPRASFSINAPL